MQIRRIKPHLRMWDIRSRKMLKRYWTGGRTACITIDNLMLSNQYIFSKFMNETEYNGKRSTRHIRGLLEETDELRNDLETMQDLMANQDAKIQEIIEFIVL